ncbi:hypothetical protein CHARACLAT_012448 [Characodon lateralis]|uniref:Uncharacterized protein n=1 Tax=Characodon lateralis TaxID=208331 RepID=A0ABU7CN05_9TELE|nr:hypothetical protein [Characodon lateralis]
MQEREQPKTQPDTKIGTQSHSHIPTLMRRQNTHTHTSHLKTHNNGHCTLTHSHSLYTVLPAPATATPEGQPVPRPRRWSPSLKLGLRLPWDHRDGKPSRHSNDAPKALHES